MKIFDSLEITSEKTANLMHDTLCLSSIAESRELSVAGGGGAGGVTELVSANISQCDDESPVFMTAKNYHNHPNLHHNTAVSTTGGSATAILYEL